VLSLRSTLTLDRKNKGPTESYFSSPDRDTSSPSEKEGRISMARSYTAQSLIQLPIFGRAVAPPSALR
jgi:hypothetical protein